MQKKKVGLIYVIPRILPTFQKMDQNLVKNYVETASILYILSNVSFKGETAKMNLCQAVNSALDVHMGKDETSSEISDDFLFCIFELTMLFFVKYFQFVSARTLHSVAFFDAHLDCSKNMVRILAASLLKF